MDKLLYTYSNGEKTIHATIGPQDVPKCPRCGEYAIHTCHQTSEADVRLNNLLARNEELKAALNSAVYSLFQVKRMVGVPQPVINHCSEAHSRACEVLDK